MTAEELRLAIEQAWEHTQKTAPGPGLEEAKRQLSALRDAQASMAARQENQSTETMFIGPGLVPCKAEGMTQLDPEAAQVLAENLWHLYQEN